MKEPLFPTESKSNETEPAAVASGASGASGAACASGAGDTVSIIKHFCEKYKISFEENTLEAFPALIDVLLRFNAHTNLTAVRDPREDCADSLAVLAAYPLPAGAEVIDVGCGAGFPGLPVKLLRRDLKMTFLDSTEKKLKFTALAAQTFGFDAVFLPERAEEAARGARREAFDAAFSRAVANLPVLCELCLPFIRTGGVFAAYKSAASADMKNPESELSRAQGAVSALGARCEKIFYYDLNEFYPDAAPREDLVRCVMLFRKITPTPPQFPRRYPQMLKKPL